jgi:hypothetical protein
MRCVIPGTRWQLYTCKHIVDYTLCVNLSLIQYVHFRLTTTN